MYRTLSIKGSKFNVKELQKDPHVDKDEYTRFVFGTTKHMMEGLEASSVECTLLLMFCNEGENLPHSFDMAGRVLEYVDVKAPLVAPPSWTNFYGPPMIDELFL
jgi:hypothetical protein